MGRIDDFDYGQNFSRFLSSFRSSVKVDRRVGRQIFFKNKNKNAKDSEFHALSNHKSKIKIYLINGNIVGKWTYLSEITLFQLPVNKAMGYKGSFTHVFFPYIHFPICCRPADRTNSHIWSVGYL